MTNLNELKEYYGQYSIDELANGFKVSELRKICSKIEIKNYMGNKKGGQQNHDGDGSGYKKEIRYCNNNTCISCSTTSNWTF